jgi:hypothetical protein
LLASGTIVGGYRVDGTLGEGGMGVVYRATQLSLNRTVALKVLATELSDDATFRERFRREGLLQAAIEHPHIVTVYEAGETEHGLFLAMRMVRGPTLKDRIQAGGLDQVEALRILHAVADALDSAHEVGLTHRDVKPQNILIGARDHAYLADFGLTNVPDEAGGLTGTGQFIGTIDYVSPEQVRGEGATSASDVYALAGVLYECLTGEVPYARATEAAVLYAHISEPAPKVTEKRGDLPAEIDEVVARGMSKDPDERHPTATELMRDAARVMGAAVPEPSTAPAAPAPGVASRAAATAPAAAAGGAIAPVGESTVARDTLRAPPPGAATAPAAVAAPATAPASAAAPPAAPPRPAERAPSRRLALAGAAVLLVVAALAGIVLGGSGSSEEEPEVALASSVSAGGLDLSFPDDWSRRSAPAEIPGLSPSEAITLVPEGVRGALLVAGTTDASGSTLLPLAFLDTLPEPPTAETVRLGELQAYRYAGLQPEGSAGSLTVYAAPTTNGVATIVCQAPAGDAGGEFLSECERVAASVQLTGGRALPLGPSEDYARALNSALADLDSARRAGSRRLRDAGTPDAQATAARRLAGAYERAAGRLSRAPAGPAERVSHQAIVTAVRGTGRAYERLGAAAARGDQDAYRRAGTAITQGEARLTRELRELDRLGYDVG